MRDNTGEAYTEGAWAQSHLELSRGNNNNKKKTRNCYKTDINIEVRKHSSSFTNEITVSYSWKLYHICFELAPKETINELYVVNTNSIHLSLPNRTRLPLQHICINNHNWTGRKGIRFGKSWRKSNMIKQYVKFKIKRIYAIYYICTYVLFIHTHTHSLPSSPDAQNFVFRKVFCLSLTSYQVPINNWAQSDKITNSHNNEINNENRTYTWESMINTEPEFQ